MEQRTKDLSGMIGQVRGFDLNEFLSNWEQAGEAIPWAVGNRGWVKETPTPAAALAAPSAGRLRELDSSGRMQ